jgi:hypothetical protein
MYEKVLKNMIPGLMGHPSNLLQSIGVKLGFLRVIFENSGSS